jgi:hypothetical protein
MTPCSVFARGLDALPSAGSVNAPGQGRVAQVNNATDEGKRLATIRASLAIRGGHVVYELASGGYLVCWRAMTRKCADLAELEAHARRAGAIR